MPDVAASGPMPQRMHDPYPSRVNCATTACASISSVLRAIPARHRILEPAVNLVEDFRRPVDVMLEGRRIRIRNRAAVRQSPLGSVVAGETATARPSTPAAMLAKEIVQYMIVVNVCGKLPGRDGRHGGQIGNKRGLNREHFEYVRHRTSLHRRRENIAWRLTYPLQGEAVLGRSCIVPVRRCFHESHRREAILIDVCEAILLLRNVGRVPSKAYRGSGASK